MAENIVASAAKNRTRQIDAAEEAALAPVPTTPVVTAGMPAPTTKPITTADAEAKAAKYKAEREAFDAEAKAGAGAPKPGLFKRLFGGS